MSKAALYAGLGQGLMALGQGTAQQMAQSAADRRQASLLALKRQWQLEDLEAEQERQDELLRQQRQEADRNLMVEYGLNRQLAAEAREHAHNVWLTQEKPIRDAQIKAYESLSEERSRGDAPNLMEYGHLLQQNVFESLNTFQEEAKTYINSDMEEVRGFAAQFGVADVQVPKDATPNQALQIYRNAYAERLDEQARTSLDNFRQAIETGDPSKLFGEKLSDNNDGSGGGSLPRDSSQGDSDAAQATGAVIGQGARGLLSPIWDERNIFRQGFSGLMDMGEPIVSGVAQGWSGQQPAGGEQAEPGTPQNPLPFGEGEPEVGLYYRHPTKGVVRWDGEKWVKE